MLWYMGKGEVKLMKWKDVNLSIDPSKSALEQLYEDDQHDGEFQLQDEEQDYEQANKFANRLSKHWGRQETELRTAIYVSFMKESDLNYLRNRIKQTKSSNRSSNFSQSRSSVNDSQNRSSGNTKTSGVSPSMRLSHASNISLTSK